MEKYKCKYECGFDDDMIARCRSTVSEIEKNPPTGRNRRMLTDHEIILRAFCEKRAAEAAREAIDLLWRGKVRIRLTQMDSLLNDRQRMIQLFSTAIYMELRPSAFHGLKLWFMRTFVSSAYSLSKVLKKFCF